MKYTPYQKVNRGASRTLKDFSENMLQLLSEEAFEKISVNEICQRSDYPRATFYNYFDDKYDLLTYCWMMIGQLVHLDLVTSQPSPSKALMDVFDQAFKVFDEHRKMLLSIVTHNPINSQLVSSFIHHFTEVLKIVFTNISPQHPTKTPVSLLAEYYSTTVLLVLKWIFLSDHQITLDTAHDYLHELLSNPLEN